MSYVVDRTRDNQLETEQDEVHRTETKSVLESCPDDPGGSVADTAESSCQSESVI